MNSSVLQRRIHKNASKNLYNKNLKRVVEKNDKKISKITYLKIVTIVVEKY